MMNETLVKMVPDATIAKKYFILYITGSKYVEGNIHTGIIKSFQSPEYDDT